MLSSLRDVKMAADTDLRLKRLCDAIESGVANLNDSEREDRISGHKVTRDQSCVDADLYRRDHFRALAQRIEVDTGPR